MTRRGRRLLLPPCLIAALCVTPACSSCRREPAISKEQNRTVVVAFYTGLAAMQTSQEVLARREFDRVVELAPQEPAGWANLGLLLLRQQEIDAAAERLARAAELAPRSGPIERLQALAASRKGNLTAAIGHWRRAVELDPTDLEAAYALALDIERQSGLEHDLEAQRVLEQLLARTENLAARVEQARLAAKRGDAAALKAASTALAAVSQGWSLEAQQRLRALPASPVDNPREAAVAVTFLKNFLLREPAYRAALAAVSTPREEVGRPLMRFLAVENPAPQPAPPDTAMTFTAAALPGLAGAGLAAPAAWAGPILLTGEGPPAVVSAGPRGLLLLRSQPGSAEAIAPARAGEGGVSVAAADLDYDFRTDLAVASDHGLRLLRQRDDGQFDDVTERARLPSHVHGAPLAGIWAADLDTDGDLDLVVARKDGSPLALRNNGDGTFAARDPFASVSRGRSFAWADLDGEGVPDAAIVDEAGAVHVFLNLRGGGFRQEPLPALGTPAVAVAAAEVTGDAVLDLLVLTRDGTLNRLTRSTPSQTWTASALARVEPVPSDLEPGRARLVLADLDNNGALDIVVATPRVSRVLLGAKGFAFAPIRDAIELAAYAAADLDGDGGIELVGVLPDGRPAQAQARRTTAYRWQVLHTRAASATGDQRINSFGIGGEVELRTGLHTQKQPITSPLVHFGLGEASRAEVIRITWPNGVLQSEFDTAAGATVAATQRLKGSCPWLFAWTGNEMRFVTDLIWRSPLGLRINAQTTADVLMTEDWVKVRGDQLAPRDGVYDLRITAELWETHFFDLVSLLVVDHPEGTEIFVDERFAAPAPPLQVVPTGPLQPFLRVLDDAGRDVSEVVRQRDSRHLDFTGRGRYQGITRRHFVEMELPEEAPRAGPLWLVGQGWVHPTDSSINVAIGQGTHDAPEGLSLDVAGADGLFRRVRTNLGFPSGKDKTILLDLSDLLPREGPRRVRLATNLEIYWDRLAWAEGRPDVRLEPRRVSLVGADLAYRGYSVVEQLDLSNPERPRYLLAGTTPRWRDLEGYYTRLGDVRELLARVDDRYVIMNAGDELRLRFAQMPPPAPGVVRDFVVIGDGWVKDGDFNTRFSRTVLPLPTHRTPRYDTPPGRLEDDPVYRQHRQDFTEYHTRFVSPDLVRDALAAPPSVDRR